MYRTERGALLMSIIRTVARSIKESSYRFSQQKVLRVLDKRINKMYLRSYL